MRYNGHNVLAIVVAAIAIWAIGFLIYVVLFQQQWLDWMGVTEAEMEQDNGRMPFMVVMPFLQAIGLSLAVKWRNAPGWMGGMTTGLLMAVFFSIAARMYGWVYSFEVNELFGLDSMHFLLTHAVAGAILGAWK
jgi:Na+/proline symporter